MKLYKRKDAPEEAPVTAIQIQRDTISVAAVWTHGYVVKELKDPEGVDYVVGLNLNTVDGQDRASEPDYVVRDRAGAFHVVRASRFERDYEEVGAVTAPAPRGLKPRR